MVSIELIVEVHFFVIIFNQLSSLLGENNYGINVHYLEHLVEFVNLHGPLSENSLFYFEALNGVIKRLCHGTDRVAKTILRHLLARQTLKRKLDLVDDPNQSVFIDRLHGRR